MHARTHINTHAHEKSSEKPMLPCLSVTVELTHFITNTHTKTTTNHFFWRFDRKKNVLGYELCTYINYLVRRENDC